MLTSSSFSSRKLFAEFSLAARELALICVDQMTHRGRGGDITEQALFQFMLGLCLPLVLTQMLRPGTHEEYFQIVIGNFGVAKDPPPICAIATSYATILMERGHELRLAFWNDRVFERN